MAELVDRKTWLAARRALLEKEKAFTHAREALSAERRRLPMVRVVSDYRFQTRRGPESLGALFKGRGQLAVYHFMFGEDWEQGCPSCSFWMDNLDGIDVHLAARDVSFVCVAAAPLERLEAYRRRMGWRFDWVSSAGSRFNADFGVSFPDGEPGPMGGYNYGRETPAGESPGFSAFRRFEDGVIAHAYSTYGRGLDMLNGAYSLLDLTPKGRDEAELTFPQAWVRRPGSV